MEKKKIVAQGSRTAVARLAENVNKTFFLIGNSRHVERKAVSPANGQKAVPRAWNSINRAWVDSRRNKTQQQQQQRCISIDNDGFCGEFGTLYLFLGKGNLSMVQMELLRRR